MQSLRIHLLAGMLCICSFGLQAQTSVHRDEAYMAQWSPDRVFYSNGYTLLSGTGLHFISQYSGGGIPVDPVTGITDRTWPKISGSVDVVIADGQGGWFVGGNFDFIDTVKIRNLAHIKADKTVDRTWKPNPTSTINAIELSGNTLYIGGYFTKVFGQDRHYLASFNVATGALTSWNPNPDDDVRAIDVANNLVYVGGSFTSFNGQSRTYVAALDPVTGVPTTWNPEVNNDVFSLTVDVPSNTIFIGGYFTSAGGQTRNRLARLVTNSATGNATPWSADVNTSGYVGEVILKNNILYVAGHFNTIGGVTRYGIAALDASKNTSNVLTWNAALDDSDWVDDMEIQGTTLYIVGYFDSVQGTLRPGAASLNLNDASLITSWIPFANNDINAIASTPTAVFLGGDFGGINGRSITGVAIINEADNSLWPFPLDIGGGQINAMTVNGTTLYLGGQFSTVNGQSRKNLAAVNLATGQLLPFNPNVRGTTATVDNSMVTTLELKDNTLYIGGIFLEVNVAGVTTARANLAAVNATTGAPTAWNPTVGTGATTSQFVNYLDIVDDVVYVGGDFNTIGGESRTNMAAIDATTGAVLAWAPNLQDGYVTKLLIADDVAYVIGEFNSSIGGVSRPHNIAAIDLNTGLATDWAPTFLGSVYDITLSPTNIYVGGEFVIVNDTESRNYVASFSLGDGSLNAWNPDINAFGEGIPQIVSIAASANRLRVTGWFEYLGMEQRDNYAEYDLCGADADLSLNGTILSASVGDSYQWYLNHTALEGATDQTLEISLWEYGVYAVEVTANGCTTRSNNYVYLVTGERPLTESSAQVYPNPVQRDFFITVDRASTVRVLDVLGTTLEESTLVAGTPNLISFEQRQAGTYLLRISDGETTQTVKIIKTY